MRFGRRLFGLLFVLMLVNQILRSPVGIVREWDRGMLWFDGFHSVLYQRTDYEVSLFERSSALPAEQRKPLLIVLPDIGEPISSWRHVVKNLPEDRSVQLVEYFGYGKSVLKKNVFTFSMLDRMLYTIVDDSSEPVVLMGHGLGGWLALRFAIEHPDRIDKVIAINPSGFEQKLELPKTLPETQEHVDMMLGPALHFGFELRNWQEFFENPMQEEIKREMLLETKISKKLSKEKKEFSSKLFILWGEKDSRTNGHYQKNFLEHFPKAERITLEDGYHSLQYTHPEKVQQFVMTSLKK